MRTAARGSCCAWLHGIERGRCTFGDTAGIRCEGERPECAPRTCMRTARYRMLPTCPQAGLASSPPHHAAQHPTTTVSSSTAAQHGTQRQLSTHLPSEVKNQPCQTGRASTSRVPGPSASTSARSTPAKNMICSVGACEREAERRRRGVCACCSKHAVLLWSCPRCPEVQRDLRGRLGGRAPISLPSRPEYEQQQFAAPPHAPAQAAPSQPHQKV